jgi:hypothetical protein
MIPRRFVSAIYIYPATQRTGYMLPEKKHISQVTNYLVRNELKFETCSEMFCFFQLTVSSVSAGIEDDSDGDR